MLHRVCFLSLLSGSDVVLLVMCASGQALVREAGKLLSEVKAERALLERQKQAVSQPKVSAETGNLSTEGNQDCPPSLSALQVPGEREKDLLDAKAMINIILSSIKPTIYIIMNYHKVHHQSMVQLAQQQGLPPPGPLELPPSMPIGFTEVEIRLMSRLWSHSLFVLRLVLYEV
ncbi:hypothetical protein DUNSADRAFT_2065 [Dunaliella salina]|uniref:Encoded protein n=1 Tax=Dunaliella salina TaxID=3046 RepID=A0ABQ7FWP4_DUNSA|nr:hypothetical protein DUNSADRAFT_2065 [Dunaliella salina]|eukprot:KAF5826785.1 hypothetical protein DUNSADRAFT_2065 [Dunaliella salina]